ncbi:MAG TPA: YihY/virulence factor BrkB family protein [Planctomycetota bacterium]|nr:YihY/virulence factor BrkB family protein [Planctomycetota bacterium]
MKRALPVAAAGAAALAAWKIGPRRIARGLGGLGIAVTTHVVDTIAVEVRRNRDAWRDPDARDAQRPEADAEACPIPAAAPAEAGPRLRGKAAWWAVTKETFAGYGADKLPRLSASLAYYTIFSLAPLLLLCLGIIGLVFDRETVQAQLLAQFGQLIGKEGAEAIAIMLGAGSATKSSVFATVIGIAILIYTATNVFVELQSAINTIWKVGPRAGLGFWGAIRRRFAPFTMILGVGFLLITSLIVSAGVTALAAWLSQRFPALEVVLRLADVVIFLGLSTLLFAMIYKVLPDVKLRWSDVWSGALLAAVMFSIGRFLIGLYLGHSSVASSFGAAGSLVVLLIWIYYSSQMLLLGAEFTRARVRVYGPPVEVDDDAAKTLPDECRPEPAVVGPSQPPKTRR